MRIQIVDPGDKIAVNSVATSEHDLEEGGKKEGLIGNNTDSSHEAKDSYKTMVVISDKIQKVNITIL